MVPSNPQRVFLTVDSTDMRKNPTMGCPCWLCRPWSSTRSPETYLCFATGGARSSKILYYDTNGFLISAFIVRQIDQGDMKSKKKL
jgi:hypothetical protein